MATTDFIAAIELSSSKISGIAGRRAVTEVSRCWLMHAKMHPRLYTKGPSTTLTRPHKR